MCVRDVNVYTKTRKQMIGGVESDGGFGRFSGEGRVGAISSGGIETEANRL